MEFLTFMGVSALVIVTPGQDTVLVLRNTLRGSRATGLFTTLGVVTGQAAWALTTSAGIAAVVLASNLASVMLKVLGVAYLVYLGTQGLHRALRSNGLSGSSLGSIRPIGSSLAYRQGLISNLSNAKVAVFFASLFPQFSPHGVSSFFPLLGLGLVFCSITLVWLTSYAFAVAKAGDVLHRPAVHRVLEGITSLVLLALGVRLALESSETR